MKKICYLLFAFLFLMSCASKDMSSEKKDQIAIKTQQLGEVYYNSGQYTAALKKLLEAYETIPDDPFLNNSLGLVYLAKDRYTLAETHFIKALKLKPDYIQAKNNLGAIYLKQKKFDLAIKCFQEVSDNILCPDPETSLTNLGWVYFHQGMYKKAKSYFKQALDIRPDFLVALHGISSIYIKRGDYSQALRFLHYNLRQNPKAAILHSDLAKTYEALKKYRQAKKSWELVVKLAPRTSPLSKEAKERILQLTEF